MELKFKLNKKKGVRVENYSKTGKVMARIVSLSTSM